MMQEPTQSSEPEIWVFHVGGSYLRLRTIVVTCGSSLLAGLGLFLVLRGIYVGDAAALIFGPICISFAIIWYRQFHQWLASTSLTLSPTMLDYRTPGLRIQTEWSNVIAVVDSLDPRWGYMLEPHLRLHNRASVYMSRVVRFHHWTTSYGWNIDRRIPLNIFGWERSSELRLLLQQLAPQHFPAYVTSSAVRTQRH
ncbi:MAG: hypothetical protein JOZ51_14745 [Chloroflexi bacterium]|nr:hypothetical protein [Chloroflexota bacterium]